MKQLIKLTVNGETHEVYTSIHKTLLEVLREDLGLTGAKYGCGERQCGACTVLANGRPIFSCSTRVVTVAGREIETIEGLAEGPELHPLQEAFADLGGSQCGYCTPGVLMTAKGLLDAEPNPSRERIKEALSGNLCRCTGYQQIVDSVEQAARKINATTVSEQRAKA